jgi:hypothetical protein
MAEESADPAPDARFSQRDWLEAREKSQDDDDFSEEEAEAIAEKEGQADEDPSPYGYGWGAGRGGVSFNSLTAPPRKRRVPKLGRRKSKRKQGQQEEEAETHNWAAVKTKMQLGLAARAFDPSVDPYANLRPNQA